MNTLAVLNTFTQIMQNSLVSILKDCFQSTIWIGNSGETPVTTMTIYETQTEVILQIGIYNIDISTLDVQISPETLLIQGYWSELENVEGYFRPSQFQTLIPLPYYINPQSVLAELEANLLQIRLPKPEKNSASKVKLKLQNKSLVNYQQFEYLKKANEHFLDGIHP